MTEPEACGDEFDKAEIAGRRFIVAGRQTPRVFHFVETSLDEIPQSVDKIIDRLGLVLWRGWIRACTAGPPSALRILVCGID